MWRKNLLTLPEGIETVLARDAEIYFIDASFSKVEDAAEQQYLMKIPTTLYLTDEQIDHLFAAASRLIQSDPEFQRLMSDLQRSP
jgi:NTE family protein